MNQYLDLLRHIRDNGAKKQGRTGTGTLSVFGHQMRFNLAEGFPLLTTKNIFLKGVIHELLWFLRGETNIRSLQEKGVKIWDDWADAGGDLGPVYGYQWRSWPNWVHVPGRAGNPDWIPESMENRPIDQIAEAVELLKKNPDSRRIVVTAWNPSDLLKMALQPCHCLFQFHSREARPIERIAWGHRSGRLHAARNSILLDVVDGSNEDLEVHADVSGLPRRVLSCQLYQRSCETFLGVPFNIASYALLTMMMAQVTDHIPGDFVWTGGDVHLYLNHMEQVNLQLSREPRPLPRMVLNPGVKDIFGFTFDDFTLVGYDPHPTIPAPIAV